MNVKIIEREVLNPMGETEMEKVGINPIPKDLNRISLFNNTKPGADIILETLLESLGEIEFFDVKKPAGTSATPQQIEKAADAEISILALGDCGSCTTWVVLDAIRLEKRGVPTISICSHHFAPFARELARSYGAKNLRIVEIEHPIAGLYEEDIKAKTLKIIPKIKEILSI
jgi:hypothetical protein